MKSDKSMSINKNKNHSVSKTKLAFMERIEIRKIPLFGNIMYSARGPVCDIHNMEVLKQLTEGAKELAKKYNAKILSSDGYREIYPDATNDKIFNLLDSHKWSLITFILAVIISTYVSLSRTFMNIEYFGMKCLGILISIMKKSMEYV